MFYEPKNGHPFRFDPFKALVSPRPIGWISTISPDGRPNLAPYSFFNAVAARPPTLMFSSEGYKHSAHNVQETGEFVFNLATEEMAHRMNLSSANVAADISEFEFADVEMAACRCVSAPRVAAAPAALECKLTHFFELTSLDGTKMGRYVIIGQVVGVHINEAFLTDDRFDITKARMIARCGYDDYIVCDSVFQLERPPRV